jgi:hypothetical protein
MNWNTCRKACFFLSVLPLSAVAQVTPQDSLALAALYDATGGPGWANHANWLSGPVSTWYGVTVSGDRVTRIELRGNGLSGSIPSQIGNLTGLEQLFLNDNSLSGSVPSEIGNLPGLTDLHLARNSLADPLPDSIHQLASLICLYLSDNDFSYLPVLPSSLSVVTVWGNRLTFEDLEPNAWIPEFWCEPQAEVLEAENVTAAYGDRVEMTSLVGGSANRYQWFKNSEPITGATEAVYVIESAALPDACEYTCDITNTIVTGLVLHRRTVTVTVNAPDCEVSPDQADFGDVPFGQKLSRTFTIRNRGMGTLTVLSLLLSDGGGSVDLGGGCPFALAPSETKETVVEFIPQRAGPFYYQFVVCSNDPREPMKFLALTGRAMNPSLHPPLLSLCFPPDRAISIPRNAPIQFHVEGHASDQDADLQTLNASVNDTAVAIMGDVKSAWARIAKNQRGFTVYCHPSTPWPADSTVRVRVQCEDAAYPPGSVDSTYSFRTGQAMISQIAAAALVDSSGGEMHDTDAGLWIVVPKNAVEDSTQISAGKVDVLPGMPAPWIAFGTAWYFGPAGLMFHDSVDVTLSYASLNWELLGLEAPEKWSAACYPISFRRMPSKEDGWQFVKPLVDPAGKTVTFKIKSCGYMTLASQKASAVAGPGAPAGPAGFVLSGNYPNPFNSGTRIRFSLQQPSRLRLAVYDVKGRRMAVLFDAEAAAGVHELVWNGDDETGVGVSAGLYILTAASDGHSEKMKMMLLK